MSSIISSVVGSIKNWWVFIVLGVLLVLASFWMFQTPVESFVGLAAFFSALIFISGILSVFFAITNKDDIENFGLFLAGGILDVIIGFILLKYPGITVLLFSLFVGFWLLFRGINTISFSFRLKNQDESNWIWTLIMGIMVVVFAMLAIVNPLIGASYLVYTLSFAILMLGLANIFVGWKLRKVKLSVKKLKTE